MHGRGSRVAAAVAAAAAAAVALALVAVGCSSDAPEELSRSEAIELAGARERLDDAIDTEETLRTSPEEARRLVGMVRGIVARGAFESEPLDEFGLAALGELAQVVPSVVETDADGVPQALDRPALRAFLRHAENDAQRALLLPARAQVKVVEDTIEGADADSETRVPPPDRGAPQDLTVAAYLRGAERDLRPIWPRLAARLASVRGNL